MDWIGFIFGFLFLLYASAACFWGVYVTAVFGARNTEKWFLSAFVFLIGAAWVALFKNAPFTIVLGEI